MIRWRAVKHALSAARKAQKAIGNTPVFPAPKNPATPCSREMMDKWLRRAFQLAELALPPHGLWHSIRRKWATERQVVLHPTLRCSGQSESYRER